MFCIFFSKKRQKFGSSLPSDWLRLVKSQPDMFSVTDQMTNLSIIYKNALPKPEEVKLAPQKLPWDCKSWKVNVSCAESTDSIWVQLEDCNYSVSMRIFQKND